MTGRRLLAASAIGGIAVQDGDGRRIGTLHDVLIDRISGQAVYAVISTGGFLGLGQAYHPLPWAALTLTETGDYRIAMDQKMLAGGPSYRPDNAPVFDESYGRRIDDYYGLPSATAPSISA